MKKLSVFILFFCFFAQFRLAGQDSIAESPIKAEGYPVIHTDRPTQSFSAYLLPARTLQVETGFQYITETNRTDDIDRYDIGPFMLRYGIYDNFEVRLTTFYGFKQIEPLDGSADTSINGLGSLRLGFKVFVAHEKGIRPEMAIVANVTLRHVGNEEFAPEYSYPTASYLCTHNVAKWLIITYNAGFAYSGYNADGFFTYSAAVFFVPVRNLSIFIEPFGNFDHGDLPNHKLNAGVTFVARNNLQLDAFIGKGFSQDIDRAFAGAGISWRIPR